MQARLVLEQLVGGNAGDAVPEVIPLSSERVIIGRSSKVVDVLLDLKPANTISRKHAEIVHSPGQRGGADAYVVRDLNSTNGVFVNGLKVLEVQLKNGHTVQFGGAADIPVGTPFNGAGSHIRYRFCQESSTKATTPKSRKRSHAAGPASGHPAHKRPPLPDITGSGTFAANGGEASLRQSVSLKGTGAKLQRADTQGAVETLRAMAGATRIEAHSASAAAPAAQRPNGAARTLKRDRHAGQGDPREGPRVEKESAHAAVLELLSDAMCGLCSQVLLDVCVLPCSHGFCSSCWAAHVEEKGTICPTCRRKFHSSERNARRCSNLDLLVTSIIEKMAGPQERQRWKLREERAQRQRPAQAKAMSGALARMGSRLGSDSRTSTSPATHTASIASSVVSAPRGSTQSSARPQRVQFAGSSEHQRLDTGRRAGDSDDSEAETGTGTTAAEPCPGCNEAGHEFRDCPHRSEISEEESEEGLSDEESREASDEESDDA